MLNKHQHEDLPFQKAAVASVKILHASPDTNAVDIYVNGMRILREFSFRQYHNNLSLPPGKYQIDIYPSGNTLSTHISKNVILQTGKYYTLAAVGMSSIPRLLTFEDQPKVPKNESKIRFIHLLTDTPPLDIAVKNRDVIFQKVQYRKSTSYLGVTPMTLDLEARIAGTSEVKQSLPALKLEPNNAYSAFLVGQESGEPKFEVILLAEGC